MASPELALVYASLILNDDGLAITAAKLTAILTAANVHVDAPWVSIFAKSFAAINLGEYANSSSLGGRGATESGGKEGGGDGA
jgi:large subunit ribosomal protein LP1